MRICIVMEYHPADLTGGSETQVFGLAREFAKAGHEVSYVCQRYDRGRPIEETMDGVRVLRVLPWRRVLRSLAGPRLVRTVRRLRPDVVYQRFGSPFTGLAALAARVVSAPFVWGCSEDRLLEKGFLLRRSIRRTPGLVGLAKRLPLRLNAGVNQRLFYYGLRHAHTLIMQNRVQSDLLRRNFGLSGVVIPNGVELRPTPPQDRRSELPLVLWVNRIAPRKNAEAFIALAASMHVDHPDTRFVLVGGRQDDEYMQTIRRQAAGVANLESTGNVSPDEVQSWLEQAWVFVITSTSEGFPNVLLQAWAAGVPVISLVVDPDGIMAREGIGLVSGTAEKLRDDVSRLLDDAGLRERLAAAARDYVAEHLDFGKVAERYLALFEAIATR